MIGFTESNFYKALQDFFIDNNKDTFLQMLSEFYNRTEGIIEKNETQDELINELRELYIKFNEEGIDKNIVKEKVKFFIENSVEIKNIVSELKQKADLNKVKKMALELEQKADVSEVRNITLGMKQKADLNQVVLVKNGININNFDEETRRTYLQLQGIDVNYVLGEGNVNLENLNFIEVNRQNIFDKSKAKTGYMLNSSGEENVNNSAFVSDYINISGYDTLTTNASWDSAFYGKNKEFIQLITTPNKTSITVPPSAYYIKIVGSINKIDEIMLTPSETLPNKYIDYNNYTVNITDSKLMDNIINKTYRKTGINDTTFLRKVIANKVLNEPLESGFIGTKGDVIPNDSCKVTNFIEVLPNTTYKRNDTWYGGAYNENKEFIETFKCNKSTAITPENCKYVRLSYSNESINDGIYLYKVQNNVALIDDVVEFVKEDDARALANQLGKYISNFTNILNGKSALYFGDSICYGEGYRGGYAKLISENNNMSYINKGVSGATITRREGTSCILDSVLSSNDTADYIILEGGTNDAGGFSRVWNNFKRLW